MTAPLPVPQYISLDNVLPYLGAGEQGKVSFGIEPNDISPELADELICAGENAVLIDLSPYYVTCPALITIEGGDWTTLQTTFPYTYNMLYRLFILQASKFIIQNFITRNTDNDKELGGFEKACERDYKWYLDRILAKLPNGSYRYQLQGLQPLATGIPRTPSQYAIGGNLAGDSYTDNQLVNPQRNFDYWWGRGGWWR